MTLRLQGRPRIEERPTPPAMSRSALMPVAAALASMAALYGGASLFASELPRSVQPAFRPAVLRWLTIGLALVVAALVTWFELRRARTVEAFAAEVGRGEDLERRAEDAWALTEGSRALNRAAPEQIMEAVVRGAAVTLGGARVCLYSHDAERNVMVPAFSTPAGEFGEVSMEHPAGLAAMRREPVLANEQPPASLSAPVIVGDDLVGVVTVVAEGMRYGARELQRLSSYAADASIAIARARALEQERRVAERLAEIDRAKSDFVAAISHELKTPLTSLLGYASILRKRADALPPERRDQFFEIMQRQGERILKLIGDLLESSRMESGLSRLRREHIEVRALLDEVLKEMGPAAKQHTVEVWMPDDDPGLWGDPSALEHVLTNLLDNAIKYSPAGTTVRVAVEGLGAEIRISVSDEGYGIAPEDLPYVFDRFRQGENVSRSQHSVGLGLFIVRSLAEAQGGRVWCESKVDVGSTFTVAFPRRAADRRAPRG